MELNLKNLHQQSREEICLGACVSVKFASKPWEKLEPWLQEMLASSLKRRSVGRIELGDSDAIRFPLRESESQ